MKYSVFALLLLSMSFPLCCAGQKNLPKYLSLAVKSSGIFVRSIDRFPVYTLPSKLLPHEARGLSPVDQQKIQQSIFQENLKEAKDVSDQHVMYIDPSMFLRLGE